MKIIEFDILVIGSGIAGQTVAKTCVKEGLTVAIADNREYGGTCANRGCDPKKVLLGPTEIWESAKKLNKEGITSIPKLNWKKLQKFKRKFTQPVPLAREKELSGLGIKLYHQSPKFIDENTLSIEGKTIRAQKIVIATGQVPRKLNFTGSKFLKSSDDFLKLKKLPNKIIIIGAGFVGMELAHMAARAGSKVLVLEVGNRILNDFDKDLSEHLLQVSKQLGIKFNFNVEISKLKKLRKNYVVNYIVDEKKHSQKARLIFNTAGRVPSIDDLNLKKGNVHYSKKGVQVNEYLQNTGNPNVYACGDVSDHSLPLSPLSSVEAVIVSENILHNNRKKIDIAVVPTVAFTIPNLASVGLSEEVAKKRYKNVIVNYQSVPYWYNAKRINLEEYAYKIIINERTKIILGAHILSPYAAETINLFTMAINMELTTDALKSMIFTYPTWANDIKSMI
ncbi:dihydrolipoyl dehydrogenase family protein [Maribacter hydrothermalis]|uniref:Dihydrolipoyl dehydrogenase n=1 Tax=Maribacter hydrothermalis TaxID=1836467 RepID=A0A1B7Z1B8_9FLAO|nr:NAD(P)/FAD-dependent oxidoreductase [Maribacter hydrothermalis]APQ18175.1 pyridine nucleotide-disulfide oxidoreductase [Maribacter hydrothermalis]OBR36522.1 pyridine nucleotide-disulfide oxidoreductase [Maribacter hydrothermalis]